MVCPASHQANKIWRIVALLCCAKPSQACRGTHDGLCGRAAANRKRASHQIFPVNDLEIGIQKPSGPCPSKAPNKACPSCTNVLNAKQLSWFCFLNPGSLPALEMQAIDSFTWAACNSQYVSSAYQERNIIKMSCMPFCNKWQDLMQLDHLFQQAVYLTAHPGFTLFCCGGSGEMTLCFWCSFDLWSYGLALDIIGVTTGLCGMSQLFFRGGLQKQSSFNSIQSKV